MSAPTRIFLAVIALFALFYGGYSALGPSRAAEFDHRFGPSYPFPHSSELRGYLNGRVEVGPGVQIPKDGLFVDVRAADEGGDVAVRRLVHVSSDGTFEVLGIPKGFARVTVELSSAEIVWEASDVVVGDLGAVDERLDPIDLGGSVFPFELAFAGPNGELVHEGQFLWRPLAGASDDVLFGLPTAIRGGVARFLATAEMIDVIPVVPGACVEFFEGVRTGQTVHLGPGTTAQIQVTGELPDPAEWRVFAMLAPVELTPELPMASRGRSATEAVVYAEVDAAGSALIPVTRAGRYRLHWRVHHARGRSRNPIVFGDDQGSEVTLAHAAGHVLLERRFPMGPFRRRQQGR